MGTTLNRDAYEKLVEEDVVEIMKLPRTLERDHAIDVLRDSVKLIYDPIPNGAARWVDTFRGD